MSNPTKISDIHEGIAVKIRLLSNPSEFSEGMITTVISKNDDEKGIIVILENGKKGNIIQINNSSKFIKKRILNENQFSENKETFGELPMKEKVIPQTIQSFLNSEGGYLYIGVKDTGTLEERLTGLIIDKKIIKESSRAREWLERNHKNELPDEKFEDILEMELMDTINKYLSCQTPLATLVFPVFVQIDNVRILEIHMKKSDYPVFYRNLSRNGEKKFDIRYNNESAGQRKLDDFYFRRGGSKKMVEKSEDIYEYIRNNQNF